VHDGPQFDGGLTDGLLEVVEDVIETYTEEAAASGER
jgi:hypothetical protein